MHESLANEFKLESYRKISTLNVDGNSKGRNIASWLDRNVKSSHMSDDTAQVTPLELTQKFIEKACALGAEVLIGTASKVELEGDTVVGVHVHGHGIIPADAVVVALGPWSGVFCEDAFGIACPMQGIKSTSIIYSDIDVIQSEPYALFCAEDSNDCHLEFYPRPNGQCASQLL